MSSYIDEVICKMPDDQEMTVASLLSRLFVHAAVPQEISSLEAWHVLLDLPRALSSRQVMALNAKDTQSFRDIAEIERGVCSTAEKGRKLHEPRGQQAG